MRYLIDDRIIFNTLEYRLSLSTDEETSVILSNTAGRVLEELIISHGNGDAVSREHLFANVWEKHGLSSSNGNLNQQISLLRKALLALGLDASAIVTLPKRGLKLNDRLNIVVYGPSADAATRAAQDVEADDGVKADGANSRRFLKDVMINFFLALSMVITAATAFMYFRQNDSQPLYFFKNIASCNVYTLRPINERERPDLTAHIQRAMAGNIEQCDIHDKVLFSRTSATVQDGINRRTFLAKCEQDGRGKLTECLNFYFYNWDV